MLEEYVRKTTALSVTHQCTYECRQVSHQQTHDGTLYAFGTPPQGYWEKLVALAARHGYTMVRSHLPEARVGFGCSGFTTGWISWEAQVQDGIRPFHVYIQRGLSPATEFFVACHELTHMLAGHPVQDERQAAVAMQERRRTGKLESFDEEQTCHLAAIAVAKQMGVKVRRSALCYLANRVQHEQRRASLTDQRAALRAAQQITQALVSYARAA